MIQAKLLALWLHRHVTAIAADPGFDVCYSEIAELIRDIRRVINPPESMRFLGPCPTELDDGHSGKCKEPRHPHPCNTQLRAHRHATNVECPRCRTTHDIDELGREHLERIGETSFTVRELTDFILPMLREPVPPGRTIRHWIATGKLIPTGWTAAADPRFLLDDLRRLRDANPSQRHAEAG